MTFASNSIPRLGDFLDNAGRTQPSAHYLDGICLLCIPITDSVGPVKSFGDVSARLPDFKFKRLTFVTSRKRAYMSLFCLRKALSAQNLSSFTFHLLEGLVEHPIKTRVCFQHDSAAEILDHVGREYADCRERTRSCWYDDA